MNTPSKKILITGGTGFIGQHLIDQWLSSGHRITLFARNPERALQQFGNRISATKDLNTLTDKYDWLINLAGEPIADKRWSNKRKRELYESRISLTEKLVLWAKQSNQLFESVLTGSAIGYYGSNLANSLINEDHRSGHDFSAKLCSDWERSAKPLEKMSEHFCILRTGIVLGKNGGMLKKLILPFSLGLGGKIASGKQGLSWIHIDDYMNAVNFILQNKINGPVNMTAPNPVSQAEFCRTLASSLKRPALFPMPDFVAKLIFGEMNELLTQGQYVIPSQLQHHQFEFHHRHIARALKDLTSNVSKKLITSH